MQRNELPRLFVIVDPSNVPSFPNDKPVIMVSHLNECVRMLNLLVKKQETMLKNKHSSRHNKKHKHEAKKSIKKKHLINSAGT